MIVMLQDFCFWLNYNLFCPQPVFAFHSRLQVYSGGNTLKPLSNLMAIKRKSITEISKDAKKYHKSNLPLYFN